MASSDIHYDDDDDDFDGDSVFAAESDVDSNFADSPADGYFGGREHPQDLFVEDSSAETKASIASAEQPTSNNPSSVAHQTRQEASPPASPARSPVDMPSANADPPPDYEAAISSTSGTQRSSYDPPTSARGPNPCRQFISHGSVEAANSHRALPNNGDGMQWPSGNRGNPFFPGFPFGATGPPLGPFAPGGPSTHHLQSMSDPVRQISHSHEETGLLSNTRSQRGKRGHGCCSGWRKPTSICNIMLLLVLLGLVLLLMGGSNEASGDGGDNHSDEPHAKRPVLKPTPDQPSKPDVPSAPPLASCPYAHYSETATFDFPEIQNFSFVEFMESNHLSGGVRGTIAIQPARNKQDVDLRLSVTYALTSPWMVASSNYVQTEDTFILQTPNLQGNHQDYSSRPCMWVFARMEIRPGVAIHTWELNTGNLNIKVDDGLFNHTRSSQQPPYLQVTGSSTFNAVRGSAEFGYWSSRETVVEVIAGSITGTFALRDLLSLKTQAGAITVNVDPQKADPDRPRPAEFVATSKSGSIKTNFPTSGSIPEREYKTRVETSSSSVQGSYILGAVTSFRTHAGSIHADLLPFFDRREPSTTLHTETIAGSTRLNVLTPYGYPGEPWKAPSVHKSVSTSGSINVVYPGEWEGNIDCSSLSGSIHVEGRGVQVTRDEKLVPMRYVAAKKGTGQGKVELKSTSSSIRMRVG
ncbi:Hypothetical predicted protein [Lecanosticta acicola]|uniref:Uncharacterized protein n=1 Tax=Lecanosticta acicola TaxID=111012 RepID=A0AAI8Z4J3_9PEZI|nr:Hypothetical predicted protein [Lecanosticta acicola]